MLFNLCSERYYKASKFGTGTQVACFPFEDHQVKHLRLSGLSLGLVLYEIVVTVLPGMHWIGLCFVRIHC